LDHHDIATIKKKNPRIKIGNKAGRMAQRIGARKNIHIKMIGIRVRALLLLNHHFFSPYFSRLDKLSLLYRLVVAEILFLSLRTRDSNKLIS
jgi:hypothetical protein